MAKLDMGILGGFSGRVGTVVGYHRRGAWFVRAYQPHIKDRKSAAQLEQRSRFKAMIQFASPATPVLRVGLRQVAADWQITEGNAFLKINKECFPRESRNPRNSRDSRNSRAIDYPSLRFSAGSLAVPAALRYAVEEGGVLHVRWSAEGGALTDRIYIYVYSPALGTGFALEGERGGRHAQALLPEGFADGGLHVWAFAAGKDGRVSATVYVECRPFGAPPQRLEGEGIADGQAASEADERVGFEVDLSVRDKVGIRTRRHHRTCMAAGGHEAIT